MDGQIDNDATLENLGRPAISYARAGADLIAPSGMMDGSVGFLRESLDEEGFEQVGLLAYAAKYASAYYGPFRDRGRFGARVRRSRGYQMDPANVREAIREVALDVEEGADIVMVKPALAYLDVIAEVRSEFDVPVAAYNVSGRVRDAQGRRRKGLDRLRTDHARDAALHAPRGRRHNPQLPRERGSQTAREAIEGAPRNGFRSAPSYRLSVFQKKVLTQKRF